MKANPVGWFEIYVKDLARARRFYETVLGCQFSPIGSGPGHEMLAFPMQPDAVGAGGALIKMEGFEPDGNGVLVYFSSEDCQVEQGRVVQAGGRIQKPKTSIGEHGFICLAIDSEGNMFGVHSRK